MVETIGWLPVSTYGSYKGTVRAPEFPDYLEWYNARRPLKLGDLAGKVVLLDFWTYC